MINEKLLTINSLLKKISLIILSIIMSIIITGCENNVNKNDKHKIIEVQTKEDIQINSSEINELATYYNYTIDKVTIQLFAIEATDGTVRIAFNTCSSCNPSKLAYFVQKGDYFECQTCKNHFHRDEIGLTNSYGCSPIAILENDKKIVNNRIVIFSDFIEKYKEKFEEINIYKN